MVDRTSFLAKLTEEDRKLIKLFQDEVDRINLLYMKAIHSNDITKANQLMGQMKKISNYLSQEYWKRAEVRLPQEYVKGTSYIDEVLKMDMVLENLSKQSIEAYLGELWPIHIEAVNALVDNSKNYVRSSLDWMERQAISMINELQQTQVREELAKGIISWEAKSNDRLIDYFTSQWISWFKDRGGKYWSMDRYVDMLVRTETSIANTQGTINRGLELWITKFWIVEHPDCCEVCAEMNGDIVDIRDGAVELPPFHPNCRGYIYAVMDEETEGKIIENKWAEWDGYKVPEWKAIAYRWRIEDENIAKQRGKWEAAHWAGLYVAMDENAAKYYAWVDVDAKTSPNIKRSISIIEIPDIVKRDTPTWFNYIREEEPITPTQLEQFQKVFNQKYWGEWFTRATVFGYHAENITNGRTLRSSLEYSLGDQKEASQFLKDFGYDWIIYTDPMGESRVIFSNNSWKELKRKIL